MDDLIGQDSIDLSGDETFRFGIKDGILVSYDIDEERVEVAVDDHNLVVL